MATGSVSKRTVDALKPGASDQFLWDSDLRGFGLKVTPAGNKIFLLQYRMGGRGSPTKRFTIGTYGSPWTPAAAREEAERLLMKVRQGVDPSSEKRSRNLAISTLSFVPYVERFTERCLKEEWPDSWAEARRALHLHVVPHLKGKALTEIEPQHIKAVIEPLRSKRASARKVWAVLSRLFSWAVEERDIPRLANPMEEVRPPPKPDDRKRVLDDLEIVAAWRASYRLNEPWGSFVRLLFATLQRRNEVAGVPWKEISRATAVWRIDAKRAKNDEDHLCPLNALAMAEFDALGWKSRGLAITTTGTTAVSGFSRMKRQLDREMLPILQRLVDERAAMTGEDPQPVKVERWTLHDIRRTGTTGMQSLGVPVEHTEAVLNHKSGQAQKGVAKVYNLWKYEPEKREALRKWGAFLSVLVKVGDGTTALALVRAGLDERSAGAIIHQLAADMFAVAGEPSNVIPLAVRRV